jgi:hypothetical protein
VPKAASSQQACMPPSKGRDVEKRDVWGKNKEGQKDLFTYEIYEKEKKKIHQVAVESNVDIWSSIFTISIYYVSNDKTAKHNIWSPKIIIYSCTSN